MSTELTERQAAELAIVDEQITAALARVAATSDLTQRVARAVALANATTLIRAAIARHWSALATLKDTPFGFATDERQGKSPYTPEQLQTAITHGILIGCLPTGGEITVISGRAYASLPHFERWAREQEGLTDLAITLGVPTLPQGDGGTALVEATASYVYRGAPTTIAWARSQAFDGRIPVRVNAGMGPDAVLGKARRKILAAIRKRVEGRAAQDDVIDDDDGRTVAGSVVAAPAITHATESLKPSSEQPNEADMLVAGKQYAAQLATVNEIGACSRLFDQYFGPESAYYPHWPAAHRERAEKLRDERVEQIRAGRGQRSNGKA